LAPGFRSAAKDLGEQPVAPRSAAVHLPDRGEHQRRAPRASAVRFNMLHLAVADEGVQMEADGVGMHAQLVGDRDDAHRSRRGFQYPQHVMTATGGFLGCPDDIAHFP
jgi:hypothetical protein